MLLICALHGQRQSLIQWLISSVVIYYVQPKVHRWVSELANLPPFPVLFYHQHRIAHLPHVYQDAHKFHHRMHDTTAFDGHIYGAGSGFPEEFFWIVIEVAMPLVLGVLPFTLNPHTLYNSYCNKFGHTRHVASLNHHADHHTSHNANFGSEFNVLLDMCMGTASQDSWFLIGNIHGFQLPACHLTVLPANKGEALMDAVVTVCCNPASATEDPSCKGAPGTAHRSSADAIRPPK